jgi:hypothetical protein
MNPPEHRTIDVEVEALDTRGGTLHGHAAVCNVKSEGPRRLQRTPLDPP